MGQIEDRLLHKAGLHRIPLMAAFELLPVCNLECKMCYVRKSMEDVRKSGGLKDKDWWLNIAKEASEMGLIYPLLTGGEPFLHPQFFEIMQGMQDMGLQVSINSNGTLIDRDVARWLGKHRPVRVNLTLYGASEESYSNLCGHGDAFQKVQNAVALLKEYDVPVKFNVSVTPENVGDIEEIVEFAKKWGSPLQAATYMFPPIRRDHTMIGKNDRLSPEEAALARVKIDYCREEPDWFVRMADLFSEFVPLEELDELKPGEPMEMTCRAGVASFWIDWQGQMTNCGMYNSVEVNLENRPFQEAWQELTVKTSQIRYTPYCTACPNLHICHTCIAVVSNECGTLNGRPEYMCKMNEAVSRYYAEFARKYYPDITASGRNAHQNRDICNP